MHIPDSKRLTFRLLNLETAEDLEHVFGLDQDPQVMQYINGGKPTAPEDMPRVQARVREFTNQNKGWGLWGVFARPESDFLGWILVRPIGFFTDTPKERDLEVGWRLKRSSWGQGIGTEAAITVLGKLCTTEIEHLCAFVDPKNQGSIRILEKLGLQPHQPMPRTEPGYADGASYYRIAAHDFVDRSQNGVPENR